MVMSMYVYVIIFLQDRIDGWIRKLLIINMYCVHIIYELIIQETELDNRMIAGIYASLQQQCIIGHAEVE